MSKILEIKNLNKDFGNLNILNNINVAIEEGDFLVLVGPSGCGKSTLLNCIAGLEPISGGSIAIDGRDMTTISPKERYCNGISILCPIPNYDGQKYYFWYGKVRGIEKNERDKKLLEVAKQLQIESLLSRRPDNFLVASASVLLWDAHLFVKIVSFDEPLS